MVVSRHVLHFLDTQVRVLSSWASFKRTAYLAKPASFLINADMPTKLEIEIVALMYYIIGMSIHVIDTQILTLGNDVHKYFQTPKPQ